MSLLLLYTYITLSTNTCPLRFYYSVLGTNLRSTLASRDKRKPTPGLLLLLSSTKPSIVKAVCAHSD